MWSELRADHVIPLGALEALLQVPVEIFLKLADLLPKLEKLCAGEKPADGSDGAQGGAAHGAAAMPEIDEDEPLPWEQGGGDDDYDLGI